MLKLIRKIFGIKTFAELKKGDIFYACMKGISISKHCIASIETRGDFIYYETTDSCSYSIFTSDSNGIHSVVGVSFSTCKFLLMIKKIMFWSR